MWDIRQSSAYDILDITKPDYLLTHISNLYEDAITYISQNGGCKLIINITGSTREDVEKIEKLILDRNVEIAFFYTNDDEVYKLRNTNIVSIPFGADIFLFQNNTNYKINKAFIVNSKAEKVECDEPHHILSYNSKLKDIVDIVLPENKLATLYKNYEEIILKFSGKYIPQIFFDAIYYGNKVYYDIEDKQQMSFINNKVNRLFKIDSNDTNLIKNLVKRKHTCLNRVKTLLSQLPSNDIINNVDEVMNIYVGDIK